MANRDEIRARALRAARAVTMGAMMLSGGLGCGDPQSEEVPKGQEGWDMSESTADQGQTTNNSQTDMSSRDDGMVVDAGSDLAIEDQGRADMSRSDQGAVDQGQDLAQTDMTQMDLGQDLAQMDMTQMDQGVADQGQDLAQMDMAADMLADMDKKEMGSVCLPDKDGECPMGCSALNDADCCEMGGGFWTGFGCAVPGPFVPPAMLEIV